MNDRDMETLSVNYRDGVKSLTFLLSLLLFVFLFGIKCTNKSLILFYIFRKWSYGSRIFNNSFTIDIINRVLGLRKVYFKNL